MSNENGSRANGPHTPPGGGGSGSPAPVIADSTTAVTALRAAREAAARSLEVSRPKGYYSPQIQELAERLRSTRALQDLAPEIAQLLAKQELVDEDIETLRGQLEAETDSEWLAMLGASLAKLYTASGKMAEVAAALKHRLQTMEEEQNCYVERANVIAFTIAVKRGCVGILQNCMTLLKKYVPEEEAAEINLWYQQQTTGLESMLRTAVNEMSK